MGPRRGGEKKAFLLCPCRELNPEEYKKTHNLVPLPCSQF